MVTSDSHLREESWRELGAETRVHLCPISTSLSRRLETSSLTDSPSNHQYSSYFTKQATRKIWSTSLFKEQSLIALIVKLDQIIQSLVAPQNPKDFQGKPRRKQQAFILAFEIKWSEKGKNLKMAMDASANQDLNN